MCATTLNNMQASCEIVNEHKTIAKNTSSRWWSPSCMLIDKPRQDLLNKSNDLFMKKLGLTDSKINEPFHPTKIATFHNFN